MKKIFLAITIFLLILNISYAANIINAKLDKSTYGPQRVIIGNLSINITGLPSSTKLVLELDGQSQEIDLSGLCSTKDASYSIIGKVPTGDMPSIVFDSAGTNINYGIDINTQNSAENLPPLTISSFVLEINGSKKQNFPTSPSLDFIADNVIDWAYIGQLIKEGNNIQNIEIPPNYLFNYIPTVGGINFPITKDVEYCENVTLPLSYSYKIKAFVQTINSNGKLMARIRKENGDYVTNDSSSKAECLIEDSSAPSTSYTEKSCEINNDKFNFIKENRNYLVCVYSKVIGSPTPGLPTPYYYIAYQGPSAINRGFACATSGTCSYSSGLDYFIVASYGNFTKEFNTTVSLDYLNLKKVIQDKGCINKVKDAIIGFTHCIYPLKFASKTDGIINITKASINYNIDGLPLIDLNPISKISYTPESFQCADPVPYYFDIDFTDFLTPKEKGNYKLNIKLEDSGNVFASKSLDINVTSAPTIAVSAPNQASLNTLVQFNLSVFGESPFNYSWDFGDMNTSTLKEPSHMYKIKGDYNVVLVVTDKNGITETANFTIDIISAKESLYNLLNTTRDSLTKVSSNFNGATGPAAEVIATLKLNELITALTFNLTKYETDFKLTNESLTKSDTLKEQEYSATFQNLLNLRDNIPSKADVLSITYDSKLNSYTEIPDSILPYGSSDSYKQDIFSLQDNINVVSNSYSVSFEYLSSRKEDFRLVKKILTISGDTQNLSVIEYIPKTVAQKIVDKDILIPGFTIIEPDPVIKWSASGSMTILYKLDSGAVDTMMETRTFLFYGGEMPKSGFENEPACGDGVCDPLEEGYCNIDCKPKYPWLFFTFLFLLIIGGVYYINFYRGKWNFRELANWISIKLGKKRLFTSESDLLNLEKYVKYSLNKGMKEEQLKQILSKKGWKKEQIDYAFKKVK